MYRFTPTLPAGETALKTRQFLKDNLDLFWRVLKPYLPFLVGLGFLDAVLGGYVFDKNFYVGGLLSNYFFFCLMITWHRIILHGPDSYEAVNPFAPKHHELIFMGMAALIGLGAVICIVIPILLSELIAQSFIFLLPIGMIGALIFIYKFIFYFPAKAVDDTITLSQSFSLTKGYIWKIIASGFFASWRLVLAMIGILFAAGVMVGVVGTLIYGEEIETGSSVFDLVEFLVSLPLIVFFQPILLVIGVIILSNYYQHALQNKPVA